ncbi:MAG: hypothetical protein M3281_07770 [Chloroflexota bacterium]|nr:hypothetical protein [Chloroflexota bacterium]
MSDESSTTRDQEERRERIRRWYAEARAMGVSDEDFYREMSLICSSEELEAALEPDEHS